MNPAAKLLDSRVEALDVARHQRHSRRRRRIYQPAALGERRSEWLLDQDGDASFDRGAGHLLVQVSWHCDDDGVEPLAVEHRGVVGVGRDGAAGRDVDEPIFVPIADRGEADTFELAQDAGVVGAEAEADDADAERRGVTHGPLAARSGVLRSGAAVHSFTAATIRARSDSLRAGWTGSERTSRARRFATGRAASS